MRKIEERELQCLTMRGTHPSEGIGKLLIGSVWKMLTENLGGRAALLSSTAWWLSTGDLRFRGCRMDASSFLSNSQEKRSIADNDV